ncbi:hypothetical protein GCM10017764_04700 [Sphingobacterium griseoflavum]|uniref:Uncharacterized protein n=1 Tax=Sphingobacterium griseoflavum TaxID=1474952 RepID=A0ABQ3HVJ8_9SPHI|nr:hypothetical protein GCM10017764_04700 [Sphingobacterium griseoflavum]
MKIILTKSNRIVVFQLQIKYFFAPQYIYKTAFIEFFYIFVKGLDTFLVHALRKLNSVKYDEKDINCR